MFENAVNVQDVQSIYFGVTQITDQLLSSDWLSIHRDLLFRRIQAPSGFWYILILAQRNYSFQMDPDPLNNWFRFMKNLFLIKNFFPLMIFKNNESYRILNTDSWECKISNNQKPSTKLFSKKQFFLLNRNQPQMPWDTKCRKTWSTENVWRFFTFPARDRTILAFQENMESSHQTPYSHC